MPNRTPRETEITVIKLARETNLGPHRLAVVLKRSLGIELSPYTTRNILRRYGVRCRKHRTRNGNKRYAANLAAFSPLEFWQIDVKYIANQTTLPEKAYAPSSGTGPSVPVHGH